MNLNLFKRLEFAETVIPFISEQKKTMEKKFTT
jgi:hypothetical protein